MRHVWRGKDFYLKETKTYISSLLYYNVFIIENNQWKFEQNRAKNKEVRDLWNLAISRGDIQNGGKLWTTLHMFCTWNFMFFHFSGDWDNFLLWNQDMTSKDVFYMAYYEVGPWKHIYRKKIVKEWNSVYKMNGELSTTVPIIWLPPSTVH